MTDLAGRVQENNVTDSIAHRVGATQTLHRDCHTLPMTRQTRNQGPGYEASAWFGAGAPQTTQAEMVGKLNNDINACLADPKLKARISDLGGIAIIGSPADCGKLIAEETEKWAKMVKFPARRRNDSVMIGGG